MRALAARALLSLLAVAALVGLSLLRLARVPRPEARAVARYAGGAVVVERVSLRGRTVGHAVRCSGRSVFERFGERAPEAREAPGVVALTDRGCRVTVAVEGCRVGRSPGCGGR